ncbi:response regulator transcription factor [Embleya scabrispora]|uniref:response regulator transcription factor n=1 Tax=Embleya scabrispora TaxID=159449 RepID=UPI0003A634C2|nr:response regulator transcription factor [Embleya scabrispora]MYS83664.1 response regulator [Streptomyces sp. SID5474]
MTIRILLVDDDELVRAGLRAILGAQPDLEVVGEADDGAGVLSLVRALRPDVVAMDVRMPRVDGIQATRDLLAHLEQPPKILIITTFENDEYVYEALRVGAHGFLLKRARPAEITGAVRALATGDSLLFPAKLRALVERHKKAARGDTVVRANLTDREADVLRAMARGLNNAEIATELFLGTETVKSHVSAVLGKLGARDRTQAVIAAYESGFVGPG